MRDESIKKVLLLGSGALKIGQAGEFDYSGTQAIKSLKEEGVEVVLVNPNIATIQTSEDLADRVYFLPVRADFVVQVIEKENVDAILLGFGGQTALNCGVELHRNGALRKHGIRVIGTPVEGIITTEDRALFVKALKQIGIKTPESKAVATTEKALEAAEALGYPVMIRAAFALGGRSSGIVASPEQLQDLCSKALSETSQVLVEECLKGWKEIEYEVVRDSADNCITVCNMENLDPMGIHTGESIVVAPSQTLSNEEYHRLRGVSLKVIRSLEIIGECNIQFALSPDNGDYRVIEVNARLSRSSALASKATGYPLAYVAAKLALGYTLPEVPNTLTGVTQACFEPALDYIVVKMPRWDLQKFERVCPTISSEMKSVGEVMSIARTFEEALQKAVRMLNVGIEGLVPTSEGGDEASLEHPTDKRLFAITAAMRNGMEIERIHELTRIDRWFLLRILNIARLADELDTARLSENLLWRAKRLGFSDRQISSLSGLPADNIRSMRKKHGILPAVKQIDSLAGEFPAKTNYLYLTYNGSAHDIGFSDGGGVLVLGSGPYCIGSSVEFDWCCVNAIREAKKLGHRTILINNNPETVSTDYDEVDTLYFEELSLERIRDICELEQPGGIIVSMGGQIPNTLALSLHTLGETVLGTNALDIDRAEDRHKFSRLCDSLGLDQPRWQELSSLKEVKEFAHSVGYPVLIRPSYVLSGAAMRVVYNPADLDLFLKRASLISTEHPVVVSKFIQNAKELELDAVAAKGKILLSAISEHVENAGVHSGDATIFLPPQKAYAETLRQVKVAGELLAKDLNITGPFNVQFIASENMVKVIECNLRASRSFPFVSKVMKKNFITLATRAILGEEVESDDASSLDLPYVGVKSPQFSYTHLRGAYPRLGVEMGSTGEVGCLGDNIHEALLKSLLSTGFDIPSRGILVSVSGDAERHRLTDTIRKLHEMGFSLYGTANTRRFYKKQGILMELLHKIHEKKNPNVLDYLKERRVDLVIHIDQPGRIYQHDDPYVLRRTTIDYAIPLVRDAQLAKTFVRALSLKPELHIKSWDEYS